MPRGDLSYKEFNGKTFEIVAIKQYKADAKRIAKELRKLGEKVRIVPVSHSKGNWAVYSR